MSKTIMLSPRLNEKTYGLSSSRVYVFVIEKDVNKLMVAQAVEAQFGVKVQSVRTTTIPGKSKRTMSITGKRLKNANGKRSDTKKAYVTLKEGFGLPFFDAVEESEQKEQAMQEKLSKAKEAPTQRRGLRLPGKKKPKADEGSEK